jgi:hypothetical protein
MEAHRAGNTRPFLGGNVTSLRVVGDIVVAKLDFQDDDEPGEALLVSEFLDLLSEWRRRVQERAASVTEPLPETYRRNPVPVVP